MLRKTSRYAIRLGTGIAFALVLLSGYFIHKEHETLSRLAHPELIPSGTDVYSRWLDLKVSEPPSRERILRWLDMVGYHAPPSEPAQPGEYHAGGSVVTVFARSFRYPDRDEPAQLLELRFSGGHL